MTEPERNEDRTQIPDDVARRILETAAEIDRGRSQVEDERDDAELTLAELREAAAEAGISKEAFEAALEKVTAADTSAPTRQAGWLSKLRAVVAWSGAVGGVIGWSSGVITRWLLFGSPAIAVSLAVASGATVYLAMRHRKGGRRGWFVTAALVLWLYLLAGFLVGADLPRSLFPGFLAVIGGMAAASLALGAVIVTAPPRMDDDSDEASFAARK